MRREERWWEDARISADGWIPFQHHWTNALREHVAIPPRCGIGHAGVSDLQSLGRIVTLEFLLQIDMDGEITQHRVSVRFEWKYSGSSGLTIHS
jgi:hypothetical protein